MVDYLFLILDKIENAYPFYSDGKSIYLCVCKY